MSDFRGGIYVRAPRLDLARLRGVLRDALREAAGISPGDDGDDPEAALAECADEAARGLVLHVAPAEAGVTELVISPESGRGRHDYRWHVEDAPLEDLSRGLGVPVWAWAYENQVGQESLRVVTPDGQAAEDLAVWDATPDKDRWPLARLGAALGLTDVVDPSIAGVIRVPLTGAFDAAAAQAELDRLRPPSDPDAAADRREAEALEAELAVAREGDARHAELLEAFAERSGPAATESGAVVRGGCAFVIAIMATFPAALLAATAGAQGPAGALVVLGGFAIGGVAGWSVAPGLLRWLHGSGA